MRIAELSQKTGVPVPTIKYYLREGLLPPGELTSPNQARYDDRHVQRLRLVRVLLDIGRLPIATIRDLLLALDQPDPDVHNVLGEALPSIVSARATNEPGVIEAARVRIDELAARRGWMVGQKAQARQAAAEVLAAFEQVGADVADLLEQYADVAERIAVHDLQFVGRAPDAEGKLHAAVVGSILGDSLLAALRRMAQEHESAKMFGIRGDDC
ncbi:MerR family transcriptional regulator [Dactylosporangium sp. AC04546]|uniref:MerR family transcriptional regulator n=1 Tax=Dactylosporangium sp. AC04546 TaxID=2862460 RepID=UPI001EDE985C|nr:MerR family transcriptional regulator [Dactylosporangium sp. AC04546]WVK82188.1 MerR family transcriptional regulator [Dactylosporangium sp. AC04546]